jgi:hypothetical protein
MMLELTSGDGTHLLDEAWLGISTLTDHKAKSWPSYSKPTPSMGLTWRKWIVKAFLIQGRKLRQPLGKWLSWDDNWPWYTYEGGLYSYSKGQWLEHKPVLLNNRLPTYMVEGTKCTAPPIVMRATTYRRGDRIICSGSGALLPLSLPTHGTFYEFLKTKSGLDWCTHDLVVAPDCAELVLGIKAGLTGNIKAISDGSFKDTWGTAAWTIGITEHEQYISRRVVCPGGADAHSSYLSELTGLYVILAIMNHFCEYYQIDDGSIEIGCDGLSALQTSFDQGLNLLSDIPDYDLIGAIYHMRKTSKVLWSYRHVKGHQDDEGSDLDDWEKQNVKMDAWAKQHLSVASTTPRHYNILGEPWQLWVDGRKVTSKIQECTYSAVHRPESEQFWSREVERSDNLSLMDWPSIGHAMKKSPQI